MEVQRIGKRGYLFVFEFGEFGEHTTNIYVINGNRHWFVVDTFLGPGAVSEVRTYLKDGFDDKPVIVVNTHAHFDHFWGNCAFPGSMIVGHVLCRQGIDRRQQLDHLESNSGLQRGRVEIVAPNVTFEQRIVFEDDGVELFHSPGHTTDSISCLDREDQVLFLGDNIGLPIPSIYPGVRVEQFILTLQTYLTLAPPIIVSSHYNCIESDVIAAHLRYLGKLLNGDTEEYNQGEYKFFNDWNKSTLVRQVQKKGE